MMKTTVEGLAPASRRSLWLVLSLAVVFFVVMFVFQRIGAFDFWYWMSANLVVVIGLAFLSDPENLRLIKADVSSDLLVKIIKGIGFAFLLYLVFLAGNFFIRFIFEQAGSNIEQVYGFKQGAPSWRIILLMTFLIGPGEEIFWRAYLQRRLGRMMNPNMGFVIATALYTAVHLATGNMVLVLAALVCGIFWGWLYKNLQSVTINVVSHTVWDVFVFIILPFSSI